MAVNEKNGNDIKSQEEKKKLDFKIFTPFLCELNVNRRLITCGIESVPDLSSLDTLRIHTSLLLRKSSFHAQQHLSDVEEGWRKTFWFVCVILFSSWVYNI